MLPLTPRESPALANSLKLADLEHYLPNVVAIERLSFPDPWTRQEFESVLKCENILGYSGLMGRIVVAFSLLKIRRKSLELVTLAVHPRYRRHGLGRGMARLMAGVASDRGQELICIVRESDLEQQLFLRGSGFRWAKTRHGWFGEPTEDAYKFVYGVV